MASFTLRATQGVQVVEWDDLPSAQLPSRLNPSPGFPHLNYQTTIGAGIVVKATPDGGAEGDSDSSLDTHLFTHWFAEYPSGSVAAISIAPGISSVASFIPDIPGNYLLVFCREQGGSLAIPIEVAA